MIPQPSSRKVRLISKVWPLLIVLFITILAGGVYLVYRNILTFDAQSTTNTTSPADSVHQQAPGQSNVLFADDFTTPTDSAWDLSSSENSSVVVADGRIIMELNTSNQNLWSRSNRVNAKDVSIEVDSYKLSESDNHDQGLLCRVKDYQNFYSFAVGTDGFVNIYKRVDGKYTKLFGDFVQKNIPSAMANHLLVSCIGSTLSFYVNGHNVATVEDSSLSSGDVGLFTGSYSAVPVRIAYDNFVVSSAARSGVQVPQNQPPASTQAATPTQVAASTLPSAVNQDGDVIFSDDFNKPTDSVWNLTDTKSAKALYADERFIMELTTSRQMLWSRTNRVNASDVSIEVDAYKLSETENNSQGVLCRMQDDQSFYAFVFGTDGFVSIQKNIQGEWSELYTDSLDKSVTSAPQNHLRADCIGNRLTLFINEKPITTVEDSSLSRGDVGLFSGSHTTVPVRIAYDNFIVRAVSSSVPQGTHPSGTLPPGLSATVTQTATGFHPNPSSIPSSTPRPSSTTRPSATPGPSSTTKPSATPGPSSTTRPSSTPGPSSTTRPSATPRPSATTRPSATPWPSATPRPSATPKPSATPRPSPSPSPTEFPTPIPTQNPTEDPYPLPTSDPNPYPYP